MKAMFVTLSLILVFGCSSNWSTNPSEQSSEATESSATLHDGDLQYRLSDIEPQELPCETNETGILELTNPMNTSIHCYVNFDELIEIPAHSQYSLVIGRGAYIVQWWPTSISHYDDEVIVTMCETMQLSLNPRRACKNELFR